MKPRFITLLAATLMLPLSALAQSDVERGTDTRETRKSERAKFVVQLRNRAVVPGLNVRLADCASIQSTDERLAESLSALELGRTPRGTWSRTLQPTEIVEALERRGVRRDQISIEGSRECEIFASTVRITAEDFIRAAENVLRAMLDDEGEQDAEWTVQTRVRPLLVPRGRKSRRLHAEASNGRIAKSSAMIRVDVLVDGKQWSAMSIAFRIQRYRNVLVTKRNFRPGEMINPGDVALQRVDIARKQFEPLADSSLLAGRVAARRLRSGETLVLADLKRPAIVRKKDNVTVIASVGRIRVARKGIALSEGGMGDRVAIQMDPKRPPISAEVIAPGLCIIRTASGIARGVPSK